jgi:hypothetical protein
MTGFRAAALRLCLDRSPTWSQPSKIAVFERAGEAKLDLILRNQATAKKQQVVTSSQNEPAELLMNVAGPKSQWRQWLRRGTGSSRDGIGAKIGLTGAGGRRQHDAVTTSAG